CHGEGGRGDGASASGFATRPSDLADGRLMNGLPDEFLVSVITHGGPAQGLAPTMPPFDRTLSADQIRRLVAFVRPLAKPDYRGAPIPWVRVFKVPEFTYFPHKAHVRADVACQDCHGPIERMPVVGADTGPALTNDLAHLVGLHPPSRPLTMGWCVECHRRENAARATRAPLDCVACHH